MFIINGYTVTIAINILENSIKEELDVMWFCGLVLPDILQVPSGWQFPEKMKRRSKS
jgi:hypothetical protein